MLIDRGADVNAATEKGHTPIFTAAEQHNTAVALILMDNGADMTLEDENENGPVDLCSGRAATRQYTGTDSQVCVCVCVRARARACLCVRVRARVCVRARLRVYTSVIINR